MNKSQFQSIIQPVELKVFDECPILRTFTCFIWLVKSRHSLISERTNTFGQLGGSQFWDLFETFWDLRMGDFYREQSLPEGGDHNLREFGLNLEKMWSPLPLESFPKNVPFNLALWIKSAANMMRNWSSLGVYSQFSFTVCVSLCLGKALCCVLLSWSVG